MIFFLVPETARYSLEELDYVFSVPHSKFIHHELTKTVPYFIKHTVLRREMDKPEPLFKLERDAPRPARGATQA